MSSESRQRLRPWLVAKISSGDIPGLRWLDEGKKIFRIPWKHGGKQDWSPDQAQIFMEWARHTGKYREGLDKLEWAKWKTRLRCAFNKAPDIEELKDQSELDGPNPFKVYMFKPKDNQPKKEEKKTNKVVKEKEETKMTYQEPFLPNVLDEFNLSNKSGELPSMSSLPSDLKSIPSLDLVRGSTEEVAIESTDSLSSLKFEAMETDQMQTETVITDPGTYPTPRTRGIPGLSPSSSPLHGATAITHVLFDQEAAYREEARGFAVSPSHSESSSSSQQTASTVADGFLPYANMGSPLQNATIGAPQVTPGEPAYTANLGEADGESIELLPMPLGGTVEVHELPSHVVMRPGTITLRLVQDGDTESPHVLINDEDMDISEDRATIQNRLNVRVYYMQNVVLEEWTWNAQGFRLYYGSDADIRLMSNTEQARQKLGPADAHQLHLPPCNGLVGAPEHEEYTKILLENLMRGIYIECEEGNIYATRLCRCVVYYCSSSQQNGIKLNRSMRTKIFDMAGFVRAYQTYKRGQGSKPSPEVALGFGNPISYVPVKEKLLISAYVLSMQAHKLLSENAVVCQDINLEESMQLSDADDYDDQVTNFGLSATVQM